ncbi:5-formyltetrahydrofolate cyclo-ligase, mitochondrial [Ananas comosus]|uniref:5-formyltetrahydrofolate cyclo-ligase n=1 Tax=Ananas comosus TaxID=4615 RepID=A0A199UH52_ANACO|nr:5-formyltetrahydrofolate cyclo-ligase, mitochondrial [Ananas comosus]
MMVGVSSPALLNLIIKRGRSLVKMAHLVPTLSSPPPSPCPALPRSAAITTTTNTTTVAAGMSKSIPDQKRALRSDVRKALKAFSPALRAQEGHQTQVKKELYVPWVEDKNSNMRMLKISSLEDLVANSMNILEPSPVDANGNQHEDVMLAANPVDLFLLPGLAFDRHGRRLGRGGGYYDVFLKKYQKLATENNWNQPLLVALAYSVQIMEEGMIPVTPCDVPIDALVSAAGVIPISPSALERM